MKIVDAVRIATIQQSKGEPALWYRYFPHTDVRRVGFHVSRCKEENAFVKLRQWQEYARIYREPCAAGLMIREGGA